MSTANYTPLKAATGLLARLLLDPAPDNPRWRESLEAAATMMQSALRTAGLIEDHPEGDDRG